MLIGCAARYRVCRTVEDSKASGRGREHSRVDSDPGNPDSPASQDNAARRANRVREASAVRHKADNRVTAYKLEASRAAGRSVVKTGSEWGKVAIGAKVTAGTSATSSPGVVEAVSLPTT